MCKAFELETMQDCREMPQQLLRNLRRAEEPPIGTEAREASVTQKNDGRSIISGLQRGLKISLTFSSRVRIASYASTISAEEVGNFAVVAVINLPSLLRNTAAVVPTPAFLQNAPSVLHLTLFLGGRCQILLPLKHCSYLVRFYLGFS
ncbi:hypothetical protein PIB30_071675 [Stylosanthes scabra]|uniref:Uncharacterized protein n=1 Tax=Stylosanthes scabra TaxID=79078 RepID=A0ABU6URA3_9FABA|nr:hypothetical protein [Stylosanthes scabra]